MEPAPAFRTDERRAAFFAAYDAVLGRWPVDVTSLDVPSAYGTTRVNVCGPDDGAPLVLLSGGGATSAVWFDNVEELSRARRVYAVDLLGDPGGSVPAGRPLTTPDDLNTWLGGLLDHLGLHRPDLCGHSYGGWIALNYALRAPDRLRTLTLLDPTQCFAGFAPRYLLRAAPMLLRPTAERARAFIGWETDGAVDPQCLTLYTLGLVDFPGSKPVTGGRPGAARLAAHTVPTLVLLAERSKAHSADRVRAAVHRLLPRATVQVLPGVSHHALPAAGAAEFNGRLLEFLRETGPC